MGSRGLVAAVIVACMSALTVTAAHGASPTDKINPAVAGTAKGALVVWEDWRTGHADIYGAHVDVNAAGDRSGPESSSPVRCRAPAPGVAPNDCDLTHPDVVWTGSDYVVGFQTVDVDQALRDRLVDARRHERQRHRDAESIRRRVRRRLRSQ